MAGVTGRNHLAFGIGFEPTNTDSGMRLKTSGNGVLSLGHGRTLTSPSRVDRINEANVCTALGLVPQTCIPAIIGILSGTPPPPNRLVVICGYCPILSTVAVHRMSFFEPRPASLMAVLSCLAKLPASASTQYEAIRNPWREKGFKPSDIASRCFSVRYLGWISASNVAARSLASPPALLRVAEVR
jgi:hypothetical protein